MALLLSKGTANDKAALFFDLVDEQLEKSLDQKQVQGLVESIIALSVDFLPYLAAGDSRN
jgi:c-di-GMP-related signal transduction protein